GMRVDHGEMDDLARQHLHADDLSGREGRTAGAGRGEGQDEDDDRVRAGLHGGCLEPGIVVSMTEPARAIGNIYPALSYDDAPAAIEWLCRAFGFTKRLVVQNPDGTVAHAELSLGPGVIMV